MIAYAAAIPLDQRQEMLRAINCVDIVRPYHELEYVSACKALDVDILSLEKTGETKVITKKWSNTLALKIKIPFSYDTNHAPPPHR